MQIKIHRPIVRDVMESLGKLREGKVHAMFHGDVHGIHQQKKRQVVVKSQ